MTLFVIIPKKLLDDLVFSGLYGVSINEDNKIIMKWKNGESTINSFKEFDDQKEQITPINRCTCYKCEHRDPDPWEKNSDDTTDY